MTDCVQAGYIQVYWAVLFFSVLIFLTSILANVCICIESSKGADKEKEEEKMATNYPDGANEYRRMAAEIYWRSRIQQLHLV
jgi:hypothetical protein